MNRVSYWQIGFNDGYAGNDRQWPTPDGPYELRAAMSYAKMLEDGYAALKVPGREDCTDPTARKDRGGSSQ